MPGLGIPCNDQLRWARRLSGRRSPAMGIACRRMAHDAPVLVALFGCVGGSRRRCQSAMDRPILPYDTTPRRAAHLPPECRRMRGSAGVAHGCQHGTPDREAPVKGSLPEPRIRHPAGQPRNRARSGPSPPPTASARRRMRMKKMRRMGPSRSQDIHPRHWSRPRRRPPFGSTDQIAVHILGRRSDHRPRRRSRRRRSRSRYGCSQVSIEVHHLRSHRRPAVEDG
jgi:hypothetical protein